ncbi:MAG: hypothetical protein B7Z80_05440 [Rhodospirillales bacterium 20-64-7]|nr:MAG: hypothetical protein B7Z80_05440 [Rhodospirillales bacterium 20-64-7]
MKRMLRSLASLALVVFALPAFAQEIPLSNVSQYLNGLTTAEATFTQKNADGSVSSGTLYIHRPGRMRFEYDPPNKSLVIAGNNSVAIFDPKSNQPPEQYPLARTPLAMLLAPQITLSGPVTVTAFQHLPGELRVTIVDTKHPGQGSLTLTFQDNPIALRDVRMVDARGNTNRLMLRTVQTGITPPPGLFRLSSNVAS